MSWDVMIFKFASPPPTTPSEIEEEKVLPLGRAADVRSAISNALGAVDWSDPAWGIFDGDGFSIEFNVGKKDPIDSIMLHVRGGGDAVGAIMALIVPLHWTALDCSSGDFLDPSAPSNASWKAFQQYRDRVIGKQTPDQV